MRNFFNPLQPFQNLASQISKKNLFLPHKKIETRCIFLDTRFVKEENGSRNNEKEGTTGTRFRAAGGAATADHLLGMLLLRQRAAAGRRVEPQRAPFAAGKHQHLLEAQTHHHTDCRYRSVCGDWNRPVILRSHNIPNLACFGSLRFPLLEYGEQTAEKNIRRAQRGNR